MCHQVSPEPEVEQMLMLLTSNIPLYDLLGLNVKVSNKPLSSNIWDKDSGSTYSELEQTLKYMLETQDTEFYRNEEFQWAQRM